MKKKIFSSLILFATVLFSIMIFGCEKEETSESVELPSISTSAVTDITNDSAKSGGSVSDNGGAPVTARGLVWSTTEEPSLDENEGKVTAGEGTGEFTCELTELTPETKYYVRAYALNSAGIAYGQQIDFETSAIPVLTLTIAANPEAGGEVAGAGDYSQGEEVPASATAAVGYEFVNWTVSGDWNIDEIIGAGNDANNEIIVTIPSGSIQLTANFAPINYTLSVIVNNSDMGIVHDNEGMPFTETEFNIDNQITLKAVPAKCHRFVNWTLEEGQGILADYILSGSETEKVITLKMGAGDLLLQAGFEAGFAGGNGTEVSPFEISTPEELANVMCYPESHFRLVNNINLDHISLSGEMWYDADNGWLPLGDENDRFNGIFDGNGHTISNLFIDRGESNNIGLFGIIELNGEIHDLTLENVNVKGRVVTGGLVGWSRGLISYCHITGIAESTHSYVGGLAGSSDGIIENCTAAIVVRAPLSGHIGTNVGGMAGSNGGMITSSHVTGEVYGRETTGGFTGYNTLDIENCSFEGYVEGINYVGGLVGYNHPGTNNHSLAYSYSAGTVKGRYYTGGAVGWNFGKLVNSYSTSDVLYNDSGSGSYGRIGGLVGHQQIGGSIENCYSTGAVKTTGGGLVGYNDGGSITSSYYDKNTSGKSDTGKGEPRTTYQMTQITNYDGWPFGSVWQMEAESTYPYLVWQSDNIPEPERYTLMVDTDPPAGGTASGSGYYLAGEEVTLAASPFDGYIFVSWTDENDNVISTDADFNYNMPGEEITVTAVFKIGPVYGDGVYDTDGNFYNSVIIGDQEWMAENLKTSLFNDGTSIPSGPEWGETNDPAFTIYPHGEITGIDSESEVIEAYGLLYNWYTLDDSRGICPAGWRVPGDDDWSELTGYLLSNFDFIEENNAGNMLKSCLQDGSPLGGDCNETAHPRWDAHAGQYGEDIFGFAGLPGGYVNDNGYFYEAGQRGYWWTSYDGEWGGANAYSRSLHYDDGSVLRYTNSNKRLGFSVRCVRDVQ